MLEESPVWGFFVLVGFDIINTNVWSCGIGSMTKFFSTCVEVILSMPLAKLHMLFFLHVSGGSEDKSSNGQDRFS